MNRSKIHLYVEQFALKTNWKLVETLLYTQGCKIYMQLGKKARRAIESGPVPWERTQKKRENLQENIHPRNEH